MKLGWATVIAATMVGFAAGPAASQAPWPQAQPSAAPSPWPQQQAEPPQAAPAPWPQQQQPQQQAAQPPAQDPWSKPAEQQMPPCLEQFVKLRKEVEKRGGVIQAAGQRKQKPSAKEACGLFNAFTGAELKMIKYATDNAAKCGIPAQIIDNMKQSHAKSTEVRTRVCQAAANGGPARAAAPPSLSDALSAPVPDSANIKTGRGTYDTLTGNPLGK
jgi:hypothetical protein